MNVFIGLNEIRVIDQLNQPIQTTRKFQFSRMKNESLFSAVWKCYLDSWINTQQ